MSKRNLVAHVNCSPWVEDGKWNIVLQKNHFSFTAKDDNDSDNFSSIDDFLERALDAGVIDSYYIKRATDPEPTVHAPWPDEDNGQHI